MRLRRGFGFFGAWALTPLLVPTAVAVILAGCATDQTAKIPVPISCVKEAPVRPDTKDEKAILAMDDYAATLTVWTERLSLKSYAEKADAVIQACR